MCNINTLPGVDTSQLQSNGLEVLMVYIQEEDGLETFKNI